MLDRTASVQCEWKFTVRLLGKRLPLHAKESCFAVVSLKVAVRVQPRRLAGCVTCSQWPLHATALFEHFVRHAGVITEASRRNSLPLFKRISRLSPTREQFLPAA